MNEETKSYEFRKLCSKDIFPMCNILSKIGIKEFKSCFESEDVKKMISGSKDDDVSAVGAAVFLDVAGIVLGNLDKCQNDIYSLLSEVSGIKVKTLQEMDISTFAEMIVDFVQKEELKDFMKVVSKFIK